MTQCQCEHRMQVYKYFDDDRNCIIVRCCQFIRGELTDIEATAIYPQKGDGQRRKCNRKMVCN